MNYIDTPFGRQPLIAKPEGARPTRHDEEMCRADSGQHDHFIPGTRISVTARCYREKGHIGPHVTFGVMDNPTHVWGEDDGIDR